MPEITVVVEVDKASLLRELTMLSRSADAPAEAVQARVPQPRSAKDGATFDAA
ncbi:MAG: hypothetical protein ACLGIG_05940 [Actinomycetes bacterium]